jgi:hypothetical protein
MTPARHPAEPDVAAGERSQRPAPTGAPPPAQAVLALQASAGNAATTRMLQREAVESEPETASHAEGGAPDADALHPDDQRKLAYARSILARIEPLPAEDEAVLRKLIPGTLVLQLMQRREDARGRLQKLLAEQDERLGRARPANRWTGPTDPVGEPDVVGGSPFTDGPSLPSLIDAERSRIEQIDGAIAQACAALGIQGESELTDLVQSRFPDLFLARAKTIALQMLTENERLVHAELKRFGVDLGPYDGAGAGAHAGAPPTPAEAEATAGLRAAAQELHTMQMEMDEGWNARLTANRVNESRADDEDMDWRTDENSFWAPDVTGEGATATDEHAERQAAFARRRDELGLKYPLLFRVTEYDELGAASDDELRATTGSELRELLENIAATRENIASGRLKVWNLNEVFEVTMQDLAIDRASPLYAAVEKRVAQEERDESILDIAMTAIGLAAAIIAALPTAGTSLVIAGTAVAVGTGVWQLSKSVGSFMAESAASDISLDPVLADISRNAPDLKAVALDIAGLGLAAFDVARVVKTLAAPIRAARQSGDLTALAAAARSLPELGERGAHAVLASVGREAEIQAGIVRAVRAIGTRFRPEDLAQVVADLARYDQQIIAQTLEELISKGRVRVLTREAFAEAYKDNPQWMKAMIKKGLLQADGLMDRRFGVLFLKPSTLEEVSSTALHEVVHHIQNVKRPLMTRFHREFEAYAAQRHYLQRLAASGVDPDMAFPTHKWLLNASNDDIVQHLVGHRIYGMTRPVALDLDDAVMDAIASVGRTHEVADAGQVAGAAGGAVAK